MTIHGTDPFATPDADRSDIRRLRGRLPSPVTLWTAGDGPDRAGLTVSSVLVVDGAPGRVVGILDEESDLWTAVERTGRFAVIVLGADDQQVADRFAGLLPAPGGLFRDGNWTATPYGPVPVSPDPTWAACRLDAARPYGYGLLIEAVVDEVTLATPAPPLVHVRGRYHRLS